MSEEKRRIEEEKIIEERRRIREKSLAEEARLEEIRIKEREAHLAEDFRKAQQENEKRIKISRRNYTPKHQLGTKINEGNYFSNIFNHLDD